MSKDETLLPVTQADRDAAANAVIQATDQTMQIRLGEADHLTVVQAFARHRISHSLPGAEAIKKLVYRAYCAGFNDRPGDQFWNDREADFDAAIAALTPSPCPGDGMREALRAESIMNAVLDLPFANTAPIEWDDADWHQVRRALSALTHSALSGDAGEGE